MKEKLILCVHMHACLNAYVDACMCEYICAYIWKALTLFCKRRRDKNIEGHSSSGPWVSAGMELDVGWGRCLNYLHLAALRDAKDVVENAAYLPVKSLFWKCHVAAWIQRVLRVLEAILFRVNDAGWRGASPGLGSGDPELYSCYFPIEWLLASQRLSLNFDFLRHVIEETRWMVCKGF